MLKNKCVFIIPYFGKFPNYFNLFLKTCGLNPEFNWIIFTDDKTEYNYPSNVKVYFMNFEELKELVNSKFDFKVNLASPYKLCDYKPAYGYIFEEYITDYNYWGHCDVDLLFGNLSNFISDDLLEKYDKLFCLGHLILYKNTHLNNRMFMTKIDDEYWYKSSFTTDKITIFDETYGGNRNINTIFLSQNKKVLEKDYSANFVTSKSGFELVTYNADEGRYIHDNNFCLFTWEKGNVFGYRKTPEYEKREFMYIHLQERKMKYSDMILNTDEFKIVPNRFVNLEKKPDSENLSSIRTKYVNFHLLQFHYKWKKRALIRLIKGMSKKK